MSIEENKAIIRRFYERVWHHGEAAAVDEIVAKNFVNHDAGPHSPDREGFKQYVAYARRVSDYCPTIDDLIAEGDKVVACLTGRGERKMKLLGLTFMRRGFKQSGIVVWRIADGKIVERWAVFEG